MTPDTFHERWVAWRNGVLASARFQRFAARFWLTRPIARARARGLFDLVAGFTYSQVLAASLETGVLDVLAQGAVSADDVAARIGLADEATLRLLRAAAALGLAERVGERWMLGQQGAALKGNRGIAEMVAHHRLLYADLADPVAALRSRGGGELARYWGYAEAPGQGDAGGVAPYSALMAASQPLVADAVIDAYPFAKHRRVLDVGGGQGAFLAALGARVPGVERAVFDLPAVVERAGERLGAGVALHGGDFLQGPLPQGYDLVTLVRVLHDHDDSAAMALLRNIAAASAPGATLLIAEPMAGTRGAEPMGDAYFGLYLWAMGSGRPRTAQEIIGMAKRAGFRSARQVRTAIPLTVSMVVATR